MVDPTGTILTNYHVVHGADEIRVELASGEEFSAKLVGGDSYTDLAVIEIDAGKPLAAARLGNSDGMRRGDWVLAIGSPFGLERTITAESSALPHDRAGPTGSAFCKPMPPSTRAIPAGRW